jgi:amidase
MQAYLARIDRYNPLYNAIVAMPEPSVLLQQAELADQALARGEYWGWMHGMPHAVKDLSNVRGMVTSMGCRLLADNVAAVDDIFVERIRAAGAIFIGKTNVPEFGLGSQSYNVVYGTTLNAYDPALTAGGSSGGAACALAAQMLPVADGSDMMGSLRNPAAYNNVIGFRPSQGRIPHADPDLFFGQLGTGGPMGRNVEDCVRLLATMAGYDERAPLSLRDHLEALPEQHSKVLNQYRIGWMGDFDGYLHTEPGLMDLLELQMKALADHGAVVERCQPTFDLERLWQCWLTLRQWTVAGGGIKPLYDNTETRQMLKPELVWEIEQGLTLTGLDVALASQLRSQWYLALQALFEDYDVLALPAAQVFPFAATQHWPAEIGDAPMDTYHRWMEVTIAGTLAGCPVVSLPAGFDDSGRPMGLQFIGPSGEDTKTLAFAQAYQASINHLDQKPVLREKL